MASRSFGAWGRVQEQIAVIASTLSEGEDRSVAELTRRVLTGSMR